MLGGVGLVFVCVPWLWCAERLGWSQRPIHLMQTFLAVPVAFIAWVVVVASGLWLAFLAYVLFGADYSWMNQK